MASKCSPTEYLLMLVTTRGKLIFILEKSNSHQTNDQTAAPVVVGLTAWHYVSPGLKQQKVYRYNNVLLAKIVWSESNHEETMRQNQNVEHFPGSNLQKI